MARNQIESDDDVSRACDQISSWATIKGPCFDCDVRSCWCGWGDNDECACHSPLGERTAPITITKLERELESERAESDNE
jgi:hypothetical protein